MDDTTFFEHIMDLQEKLTSIWQIASRVEQSQITILKQLEEHDTKIASLEAMSNRMRGMWAVTGGLITASLLVLIERLI